MLTSSGEVSASEGHFPMVRCRIVVTRHQPDLWRDLTNNFSQAERVEVILDRRHGERWQWAQTIELQALGADRRRPPGVDTDLRSRAFVVVPRP